jgi:uncharacterized protein (TIGR02466 family)
MVVQEIFAQHLFSKCSLNFDTNYLNQLRASIELIRRGDVQGHRKSNIEFGWQSSDDLPQSGPFEILTQQITKKAYEFCKNLKNFNFSKVEMESMWANINYEGDINWPHIHGSDIAGVFYVSTNENCGDLVLNSYAYNEKEKLSNYLYRKNWVRINPINNLLVLFDSSCYHHVLKNHSKKPRVSISFNIKIHD